MNCEYVLLKNKVEMLEQNNMRPQPTLRQNPLNVGVEDRKPVVSHRVSNYTNEYQGSKMFGESMLTRENLDKLNT